MKYFLLSLFFCVSVFGLETKSLPEATDKDNFYVLDGINLALYGYPLDPNVFGDLNEVRGRDDCILKVPVKALGAWGVRKGDVFQSVYFDARDVREKEDWKYTYTKFKLGDDVFVHLKRKMDIGDIEKNDPAYNHFTIFLGDEAYAKSICRQKGKHPWLLPLDDTHLGFAYRGEGRSLQASEKEVLKTNLVPRSDPIYKRLYEGFKNIDPDAWIKVAEVFNHKIYLRKTVTYRERKIDGKDVKEVESTGYSQYILSNAGELELIDSAEREFPIVSYGPIKGAKVLVEEDNTFGYTWPTCKNLFILSPNKAEVVRLPCRGRDFYRRFPEKSPLLKI